MAQARAPRYKGRYRALMQMAQTNIMFNFHSVKHLLSLLPVSIWASRPVTVCLLILYCFVFEISYGEGIYSEKRSTEWTEGMTLERLRKGYGHAGSEPGKYGKVSVSRYRGELPRW